jgi:hypothetical protein
MPVAGGMRRMVAGGWKRLRDLLGTREAGGESDRHSTVHWWSMSSDEACPTAGRTRVGAALSASIAGRYRRTSVWAMVVGVVLVLD